MKDAADLNVNDREELIFLLTEAAEFEHTVMCSYLYAQWSLKRNVEEGVTPGEMEAIDRWRRSILQVAMEEMLHLSLVNNLLAAIGAAPHLVRVGRTRGTVGAVTDRRPDAVGSAPRQHQQHGETGATQQAATPERPHRRQWPPPPAPSPVSRRSRAGAFP